MGSGGYRHLGDEMFVVDPNFTRGKIPYDPLDSFQHQFNKIKNGVSLCCCYSCTHRDFQSSYAISGQN